MISIEPRPTATINVVTRSGAATNKSNMEKRPAEAWVCKAPEKIPAFDIAREKETFMEVKKYFTGPSTYVTPAQHHQLPSQPQEASLDKVSTLSSLLKSCLKILRN